MALLVIAGCSADGTPVESNGDPNANRDGTTNADAPQTENADGSKPAATFVDTLTPGLVVASIALFQSVKVPLVDAGVKSTSHLPIIAGRQGLVRVYVTPSSSFTTRAVTAVLTLTTGGKALPPLTAQRSISHASTDADATGCFDFAITAEMLAVSTTYSVTLTSPELARTAIAQAPANSDARYPKTGEQTALGASAATSHLRIMWVPVSYGADKSARTPDLSASMLQTYANTVKQMYPVADVQVTAHAPVTWNTTIAADGTGWDQILNAVVALRAREQPADDVYYYGAFMPGATFNTFCQRGCVAGLSGLAQDATDPSVRASVGLGYASQSSADTMAHEVGHAHGRAHAPCGGVSGTDPAYPYADANIGTLGYNIFTGKFLASSSKDMMSYCDPTWISDYTYGKLFTRIAAVNAGANVSSNSYKTRAPFKLASIDAQGRVRIDQESVMLTAPQGEETTVVVTTKTGHQATKSARFYAYDHLPGGMLLMPDDDAVAEDAGTGFAAVSLSAAMGIRLRNTPKAEIH